jgi:hypothetical protein
MNRSVRALFAATAASLIAGVVASGAAATAHSGSAKAWCAAVIRINTKYGSMKNKTFIPSAWLKVSVRKGVVDAALRQKSQLLAITPSAIKTAQQHELVWFAHMKAAHYGATASSLPMTAGDAETLAAFERTRCGIKGV